MVKAKEKGRRGPSHLCLVCFSECLVVFHKSSNKIPKSDSKHMMWAASIAYVWLHNVSVSWLLRSRKAREMQVYETVWRSAPRGSFWKRKGNFRQLIEKAKKSRNQYAEVFEEGKQV